MSIIIITVFYIIPYIMEYFLALFTLLDSPDVNDLTNAFILLLPTGQWLDDLRYPPDPHHFFINTIFEV